jgi:hypothetical protein
MSDRWNETRTPGQGFRLWYRWWLLATNRHYRRRALVKLRRWTKETDPRPDPLPYGYNRFMTARNEANEPDPFGRPTQETDE